LALDQSPDAILAKHRYRSSYWQYRTHKAEFLPSLNLDANIPNINRSISRITLPDGSDAFIQRSLANSSLGLSVQQNVSLTGGQFFINSNLQRIDLLSDSTSTSYLSTPISIGFTQPLFGFNSYKWQRKVEPLQYEIAKKQYIESIEDISLKAVEYFFDLALAKINLNIAETNYSNNDTLYKIAQGRYNIGTIAQNDLLQMELNFLNSGLSLNQTKFALESTMSSLRSFLGFNDKVIIEIDIPKDIPQFMVDLEKAKEEAIKNNPEILSLQKQLIEAERDVARAKSENLFNANLIASYGLTQSAYDLNAVYENPQDQQQITVGLQIPIVDWGLGKGKYKMAQSAQEVAKASVQKAMTDFEQSIFLKVMQFNMQAGQVKIATKSDTVAQMRYEITKQRFLIGKINVTDLTIALTEKDGAKRDYISALRNYWNSYFFIRRVTLFDFEKQQPLNVEFDKLLE
jgi:outer membrane protein TolC